jgi:hypothetical protein
MTTNPTAKTTGAKTGTAKVIPIKAAKSATQPDKATSPKTTAAPKARTPRAKKAPAAPAATFPQAVLGYLQVAVQGPLGPGGIAHRIARYPVTAIEPDGHRYTDELIGAACLPTTICEVPSYRPDDEPVNETVPTIVCRSHSAAFAQAHGVTRCTNTACWPVQPTEGDQR